MKVQLGVKNEAVLIKNTHSVNYFSKSVPKITFSVIFYFALKSSDSIKNLVKKEVLKW